MFLPFKNINCLIILEQKLEFKLKYYNSFPNSGQNPIYQTLNLALEKEKNKNKTKQNRWTEGNMDRGQERSICLLCSPKLNIMSYQHHAKLKFGINSATYQPFPKNHNTFSLFQYSDQKVKIYGGYA